VIGGGDWAEDRLIPDFMRAIVKKQKVFIRNPYAVRPWQHVLEPLKGYLMLCQKLYDEGASFSESFNFGPHESDAKNVEWIVEHLVSFWGESVQYEITSNASQFHEAHFLKLDCAKARAQLAWQPLWNIEEALQRICAWHKAHLNGEDMHTYSLNDIKIHKLQ
jgi:CDP-glucose 4,6-dehydratase